MSHARTSLALALLLAVPTGLAFWSAEGSREPSTSWDGAGLMFSGPDPFGGS